MTENDLLEYIRINNLSPFQAAMRFSNSAAKSDEMFAAVAKIDRARQDEKFKNLFKIAELQDRLNKAEDALRFYVGTDPSFPADQYFNQLEGENLGD